MKIEQQVCSLGQAKKLYDLGINQDSLYCFRQSMYRAHMDISDGDWRIKLKSYTDTDEILSAFTVAELGMMLPVLTHSWQTNDNCWFNCCLDFDYNSKIISECNEAQVRAAMLIHLLEKNLIPVDEVNKRLSQ